MISLIANTGNIVLAGDGSTLEVEVDLDDFAPNGTQPLPSTAVIADIGQVSITGPSPLLTVTAELVSGTKHVIKFTFSTPLNQYAGNNAYAVSAQLLLEPVGK